MKIVGEVVFVVAFITCLGGGGIYVISRLIKSDKGYDDAEVQSIRRIEELGRKLEALQGKPSPPAEPTEDQAIARLKRSLEALHNKNEPPQPPAQAPDGNTLEVPVKPSLTRKDVQDGFKKVAPAVKQCGMGIGGVLTMKIRIDMSGSVSTAAAADDHAGTPVEDCAVAAVKRAVFPVSGKPLLVKFPFRL